MGAKKTSQLTVITRDKTGMLEAVSAAIAASGANITALCAYAMEGKAHFMVVTDDNKKASGALKAKGFEAKENEAVAVKLENKSGMLSGMGARFAKANINLGYIYGTVADGPGPATLIFNSDQNDKAVELMK